MFVAVDNEPLTSDLLRQLSAGAVKLLLAVRAEPGESQARYITILGFCERSVRNFGRELLDFGLVQRTIVPGSGRRTHQAPRTRHQSKYEADSRSLATDEAPVVNAIPVTDRHTDTDLWLTDLNEAQQVGYGLLRGQGVEPNVAHDLVQKCDQALIGAAITYSQNRRPNSPAAYLVWCLKNAALWYQFPGTPVDATEVISDPTAAIASIQTSLFAATAVGSAESMSFAASAGLTAVNLTAVTNTEHGLLDTQIAIQPETFDTLLLAYAVEAATGSDVRLNNDARQMVEQFQQAGYTAEDVAVFTDEVFPQCDWRGQKGEQPTLAILRDGIAAVRHQLYQTKPKSDGLLYRVQAIRCYTRPDGVSLMTLGELWSSEVQAALAAEARVAEYCPGCDLPWAMCRCKERQPTPGCNDLTARWWQAMIGHMKVGLARTTFETYVAPLRLIGFEPDVAGDRFVAECLDDNQRAWLSANLLPQMIEVLTRLHYHSANTVEDMTVQAHISLILKGW